MNSEGVQYLLKMSETLAEMNGKMGQLCERLAAHEARISQLEQNRPGKNSSDTLVRIILYLAAAAAALSGAGSFLLK